MGIARPGDMGFDIVHYNLHKTFTQPHGGGGPGAGPIAVSDRIEPFLPTPQVRAPGRRQRRRPLRRSTTTGPSRSASCAASRATSACSCAPTPTSARSGATGCEDVSQVAVLNANYLKARLAEPGIGEYLPIAFDRTCMHEFVLSGRGAKEKLGVRTLDIAKRMLDHGVHPPTVYFPLLVDEALMIEPTETETEGAARRLRRRRAGDPRGGGRGPGDRPQRALHDARCAGSTRPARRSARWSAGARRSRDA